uniref:Uncharacterized protein n=1 Tax=Triticum urartu TaxID=4572 RepID=A0A8R7UHB0_TRIUA
HHRVALDLEVERGERGEAADAEEVCLPRHGGEESRQSAVGAGGVARSTGSERAVEHSSAVDEERLGLGDEDEGVGGEARGLLVDALVPPVAEEDGVLLVVRKGLDEAVRHGDHDHAVEPRHALHPVVRMVQVKVSPGRMGHCVTPATPSAHGVPIWRMPCQWMAVFSVSSLLWTATTMVSPSVARMVGPGASPLTVTASFSKQSGDFNW